MQQIMQRIRVPDEKLTPVLENIASRF